MSERPPDSELDLLATVEGNETLDHDSLDGPARVDPSVSAEREPGDHVGRYLLVDRIGRGGMGVVYAAYDPELDRKIALKLVRPDANSAASSERLIREAQSMARLNHRNVITVHDVGRLDDDAVFIAMEYVDGPTLAAWQRDGERTWQEILGVYMQAARGVAAAHDARLVHRDFKPENVLLDRRGRAVVLDFGLARHDEATVAAALSGAFPAIAEAQAEGRVLDARELMLETLGDSLAKLSSGARSGSSSEARDGLTRTGALLGTPAYMAPEQHAGTTVDSRSDQFAFCVSLWEGLYGERPFAGEQLAAVAFAVLQGQVRDQPSDTEVPSVVNEALRRGLSVDPAERFPDMHALLEALEPPRPRAGRASIAALGVTSVGFAVALGFALTDETQGPSCARVDHSLRKVWNEQRAEDLEGAFERTNTPFSADAWSRARAGLDAWADKWRAMRIDACEATRLRGDQSESLMDLRMACLDSRLAEVSTVLSRFANADSRTVEHAPEVIEGLAPLTPCADAESLTRLTPPPADPQTQDAVAKIRTIIGHANAANGAGDKDGALRFAEDAYEAAVRSEYPPVIADAAIAVGQVRTEAYQFDRAEEALREAVLISEQSGDPRVGVRAWIALLAVRGTEQFEMKAAHDAAAHARAYLHRFGNTDPLRAEFHENFAQVLEWEGKYVDAIAEAERALSIVLQNEGEVSLAAGTIYTQIGNSHWELGNLDEALRFHEKAHALDLEILGPAHPARADALSNMGIIHDERGDYATARKLYEESIAIVTDAGRADAGDLGVFHNNMGSTYLAEGDWQGAARHYELAYDNWVEAYGRAHPDVAMVSTNLALIDENAGQLEAALAKYDRAIAIYVDHFGPEHREVAWTRAARADILRLLGRQDEAREALRNAIEQSIAAVGADHEDVAQARIHLGRVFLDLGQWTEAKAQFARAHEIRTGRFEDDHQYVVESAGLAAVAAWEAGDAEWARPKLVHAVEAIAKQVSEDDTQALIYFAHARALLDEQPDVARASARRALEYYETAPSFTTKARESVVAWLAEHP